MITALGLLLQELSQSEYQYMSEEFQRLIPRDHSLLAYHMWMKRSNVGWHMHSTHTPAALLHNSRDCDKCPKCLKLFADNKTYRDQVGIHDKKFHFDGNDEGRKRNKILYSLLKTEQYYMCILGCRDGSVTCKRDKIIGHLMEKHTDEELADYCMSKE